MASELQVIDAHGELLDIRESSTERLARAVTDLNDVRDRLRDVEAAVSEEILRRLDQRAEWTIRVDDDDTRYEIKAPSPAAGTESYPERDLEAALGKLISDGVISAAGAEQALRRMLAVEFTVPWGTDPERLVSALEDAVSIQIAGEQVNVAAVEARRKAVKAGVNKLLKIPGTRDSLEKARYVGEPPARRVKVTAHKRMRP